MKRQKGFTLVEVAIAIGVVAILSGIIIPLVLKSLRDARVARARNDLQVIAGAIAHQIKDTGHRPRADGGNGVDGRAHAIWYSEGNLPVVEGGAALLGPNPGAGGAPPVAGHGTTFRNLFAPTVDILPLAQADALFGLANARPEAENRWRGPYLPVEATQKTDPWGNAYLILGYNERGEQDLLHIFVISAGPDGTLHADNVAVGGNQGVGPGASWNYNLARSANNLVLQVN